MEIDPIDKERASHLPLVFYSKYLTKYPWIYIYKDDIIQSGEIGLIRAYNSYDPKFGTSINTHCFNCVHSETLSFLKTIFKHYRCIPIEDMDFGYTPTKDNTRIILAEKLKSVLDPKDYQLIAMLSGLPPYKREYTLEEIKRDHGDSFRAINKNDSDVHYGKSAQFLRVKIKKLRKYLKSLIETGELNLKDFLNE